MTKLKLICIEYKYNPEYKLNMLKSIVNNQVIDSCIGVKRVKYGIARCSNTKYFGRYCFACGLHTTDYFHCICEESLLEVTKMFTDTGILENIIIKIKLEINNFLQRLEAND